MNGDYAKHAAVWDWDGYDNSAEYDYWCKYAIEYGKNVLIPMCALGQVGAYMADRGFCVTAFDITKEMIDEGKKRFGYIHNLSLNVADICNFDFQYKQYDFCFLSTQDFHLLTDINSVKKALKSISTHMRKGGCLVLELVLPMSASFETPVQRFYPRVTKYADKEVWKDGKNRYDAISKKQYIEQTVYVRSNVGTESFDYSVVLQYFDRTEILGALSNADFSIIGEYADREKTIWGPEYHEWMIEVIKQ